MLLVSNGKQSGPRIGMEKGPLTGLGTGKPGWHSGAVFEAPALVAGFDDFAMMGQAIEGRGCHLGVAKHTGQSPKAKLVVMMTEVRS